MVAFSVEGSQLRILMAPANQRSGELQIPSGLLDPQGQLDLEQVGLQAVRAAMGIQTNNSMPLEQLGTRQERHENELRVGYLAVPKAVDVAQARCQWREAHQMAKGRSYQAGVIKQAIDRLQEHVTYGSGTNIHDLSVLAAFLRPQMTIPQLHSVAQAILNKPVDARNFARDAHAQNRFGGGLEEIKDRVAPLNEGRPAQLYRFIRPRRSDWPKEAQ